jgi:hypothetical protein
MQGAGMPMPPPMFHPMQHAAPRSSSTAWIWILLLGGVVMMVLLLGVGILLFRARGASSSTGPTSAGPRTGSGRLRDLTGSELEARLKSRGWEISGESKSTNEAFRMHVFQLSRSGASGTVQLYEYADENMAKLVEEQLQKNQAPGSAMERDGGKVLFVLVVSLGGGSSVSSTDLLADVKKP